MLADAGFMAQESRLVAIQNGQPANRMSIVLLRQNCCCSKMKGGDASIGRVAIILM